MSVRRAADAYHVPKSTLQDRLSGRVGFGAKSGPQKYLSDLEEELVSFLIGSVSIGFARTRKQVLTIVQNVVAKKESMLLFLMVGGNLLNKGTLTSPLGQHSICHIVELLLALQKFSTATMTF